MTLRGPATAAAGGRAPLTITVANTGSGHDFPTGFPEGRIAWVAVHAFDLGDRHRAADPRFVLEAHLRRRRQPDHEDMIDPALPGLRLEAARRARPIRISIQFKAVASLGDGCPTLDLPYAAPLNMVTNARGLPIDEDGRVIDAAATRAGCRSSRT